MVACAAADTEKKKTVKVKNRQQEKKQFFVQPHFRTSARGMNTNKRSTKGKKYQR